MNAQSQPLACPICSCGYSQPKAVSRAGTIFKCKSCRVVYSTKHKNKLENNQDYYKNVHLDEYFNYYEAFRKKQARVILDKLKKVRCGSYLLDIGCSFGWFLDEAETMGFNCHGIENSPLVMSYHHQKQTKQVIAKNFNDMVCKKFDVITLLNVLEHLEDPNQTLDLLKEKLKDDGYLVIAVPNRHGLFHQLSFLIYLLSLGKLYQPLDVLFQFDNDFYHRFCFSWDNCRYLLGRSGYKIVSWYKGPAFNPSSLMERLAISNTLAKKMKWFLNNKTARWLMVCLNNLSKYSHTQDEIVIFA